MAYLIITFLIFIPEIALSAACCGGSGSSANIITGDYKSQFNMAYNNRLVTHEASSEGILKEVTTGTKKVEETFTLAYSSLLSNYSQLSLSLPFKKFTYTQGDIEESSSSLSDPKIQFSYEFLPELFYSKWKPRGFIFVGRQVRHGNSIYDSEKALSSDALSSGVDRNIFGFALYKVRRSQDFSLIGNIQIPETRIVNSKKIKAGNIETLSFSFGRSFLKNYRIGANINNYFEGAKTIEGERFIKSTSKSYTQVGLNVSYMNSDMIYSLGYTDQTLIGKTKGILAGKSLSFGLSIGVSL